MRPVISTSTMSGSMCFFSIRCMQPFPRLARRLGRARNTSAKLPIPPVWTASELPPLAVRWYVLVYPIEDHVRDLELLRVQHHHVRHAENTHVVQLQVIGL